MSDSNTVCRMKVCIIGRQSQESQEVDVSIFSSAIGNINRSILSNKNNCLYQIRNLNIKQKNNSSWCYKHKYELNELPFQVVFSTWDISLDSDISSYRYMAWWCGQWWFIIVHSVLASHEVLQTSFHMCLSEVDIIISMEGPGEKFSFWVCYPKFTSFIV